MANWNARIVEQGNGLPDAGAYVGGDNGELYRIVAIESRINTAEYGRGNWCRAAVAPETWSDVEDDDVFPALAVLSDLQD